MRTSEKAEPFLRFCARTYCGDRLQQALHLENMALAIFKGLVAFDPLTLASHPKNAKTSKIVGAIFGFCAIMGLTFRKDAL